MVLTYQHQSNTWHSGPWYIPKTTKYLCVHGQFYQPPRENPFIGDIPKENGAEPFDNFNEKITAECYRSNAVQPHSTVNVLKGIFRGRPRGRFGTLGSGNGLVRGRPRGRLGREASATGCLRGRPRRFGSTQGAGAILYLNTSEILQRWSVRPLAIAGVCLRSF